MLKRFFRSSKLLVLSFSILTLTGCACSNPRQSASKDTNKNNEIAALTALEQKNEVNEAVAEIKSLKGDDITGTVTFTKVADGIKVVANVKGLTPGKHGFHVHEFGNCSDEGSATGDHFNPTRSKHGGPDSSERHVGDLGNLEADEEGNAKYERIDKMIALDGENSILNRSVVIHSDADDFETQPSGNSGKKIACGVVKAK